MEFAAGIAAKLITVAILVEAVVELIKSLLPVSLTSKQKQLIALICGLGASFIFNITLLGTASTAITYTGIVLAGLVISRGSNFAHEFIKIVETLSETLKNAKEKHG